jgi:hypothetical protein
MANMLQSSQTQATQAPGFYTDYLSGLATKGQEAAGQAKFAGEQPLQTQAFCKVATNFGTQQPAFQTGQGYVGQAAGQDVTGAALPYLQAGTTASPLCAAKPLICQGANLNLACLASQYMSPYIQTAVQNMSDIAQRNIRQNLSPAATAAAVGSGQFGSRRGAQVLGQIQEQAQQDLNTQIAQMLNQGYTTALCAAKSKQGALGQAAQTTASAQQAQNQANLTAGQTAASAAANEGQLLNTAGQTMGALGTQAGTQNLACINALATLGGQQQTIEQNKQNFPLTNLANLSTLLQGYSIPTSTKTTLCMSPLSGVAAVGTGLGALLQNDPKTNKNMLENITGSNSLGTLATKTLGGLESMFTGKSPSWTTNSDVIPESTSTGTGSTGCEDLDRELGLKAAHGGLIQARAAGGSIGCITEQAAGGMPSSDICAGMVCNAGGICSPYSMARGGLMKMIASGQIGCMSTKNRGGLPSKKG